MKSRMISIARATHTHTYLCMHPRFTHLHKPDAATFPVRRKMERVSACSICTYVAFGGQQTLHRIEKKLPRNKSVSSTKDKIDKVKIEVFVWIFLRTIFGDGVERTGTRSSALDQCSRILSPLPPVHSVVAAGCWYSICFWRCLFHHFSV